MRYHKRTKRNRIISDPTVINLITDSEDTDSMWNLSQQAQKVELNFSIEMDAMKRVNQLQEELVALLVCEVQDPFIYDDKIILAGCLKIKVVDLGEVISNIIDFCRTHFCYLTGWTAFETA